MRKRLIKLTGVLLISGASSIALAMPASAGTLTAISTPTAAVTQFQSPIVRLADTATGTTTGTAAFLTQLATSAITAGIGPVVLATVVK
jgi:hypothetical protein